MPKRKQYNLSPVERVKTGGWNANYARFKKGKGYYVNGNKTANQVFTQISRIQKLSRELQNRAVAQARDAGHSGLPGEYGKAYHTADTRLRRAWDTQHALGNLSRKSNDETISTIANRENRQLAKLAKRRSDYASLSKSAKDYEDKRGQHYRNSMIETRAAGLSVG